MVDPLVTSVAVIGAITGVAFRALTPYFQKVKEIEATGGSPIKFLNQYKFTAAISLITSIITAAGLFSGLTQHIDVSAGIGMIFIAAMSEGYMFNSLLNRVDYTSTAAKMNKIVGQKKAAAETTEK